MENKNKKTIYEYMILNKAFHESLDKAISNDGYSWYHWNNNSWYKLLSSEYGEVLGINHIATEAGIISACSAMEITTKQKIALKKVKREPIFIRLMGETALSGKQELERLLGVELTSKGGTYGDENGLRESSKSFMELENDLQKCNDKLDELFSSGTITEEQYNNYGQQLDYIFGYFISQSKGQQIPFRQISDVEIKELEKKADDAGITFDEALKLDNMQRRQDFLDFQESIQPGK